MAARRGALGQIGIGRLEAVKGVDAQAQQDGQSASGATEPTVMSTACLRLVLALALIAPLAGCRHAQSDATLSTIDWHTSPLDLNLRGMNGKSYRFRCPPGKPEPASVTGSGMYADASSICAAAAHAGAIDAQLGGPVTIRIFPGRARYPGTTRNFIRSAGYPHAWSGSFAVLPAGNDAGSKP